MGVRPRIPHRPSSPWRAGAVVLCGEARRGHPGGGYRGAQGGQGGLPRSGSSMDAGILSPPSSLGAPGVLGRGLPPGTRLGGGGEARVSGDGPSVPSGGIAPRGLARRELGRGPWRKSVCPPGWPWGRCGSTRDGSPRFWGITVASTPPVPSTWWRRWGVLASGRVCGWGRRGSCAAVPGTREGTIRCRRSGPEGAGHRAHDMNEEGERPWARFGTLPGTSCSARSISSTD